MNIAERGFIYVASRDRLYYELALISLETLKAYYPDSHVTLFTHQKFIDDRAKAFDKVITGIPNHVRAKMWCMARTPYQKTVYIDCDSIIRHRDIRIMHDFLEDHDMFFGGHIDYTVANMKWAYIDRRRNIPIVYHGSMCGYNKTDITIDFMQTWFDEYIKQVSQPEWDDRFFKEWKQFDMFTLWRMTSKKFSEFDRFNDLKIKLLERRFNNTIHDLEKDAGKNPVITQIDRDTWKQMKWAWKIIKSGTEDMTHYLPRYDLDDPVLRFN